MGSTRHRRCFQLGHVTRSEELAGRLRKPSRELPQQERPAQMLKCNPPLDGDSELAQARPQYEQRALLTHLDRASELFSLNQKHVTQQLHSEEPSGHSTERAWRIRRSHDISHNRFQCKSPHSLCEISQNRRQLPVHTCHERRCTLLEYNSPCNLCDIRNSRQNRFQCLRSSHEHRCIRFSGMREHRRRALKGRSMSKQGARSTAGSPCNRDLWARSLRTQ